MSDWRVRLGAAIARRRRAMDLSPHALAVKITTLDGRPMRGETVQAAEAGAVNVETRTLERIAAGLGVNFDALLRDVTAPDTPTVTAPMPGAPTPEDVAVPDSARNLLLRFAGALSDDEAREARDVLVEWLARRSGARQRRAKGD